jgi:hypothetical protein
VLRRSTPAGQSKTPKSAATQEYSFKEVRRRKRHRTNETAPISKKAVPTAVSAAPLRATSMDMDSSGAEATTREQIVSGKASRPPPIILTSKTNLFQFQKQLKNVVKDDFEFRSTRNGTRVIIKGMADFEAAKSHFNNNNNSNNNLSY